MRRTDTITLGKHVTPEEAYMNGLNMPEPEGYKAARGILAPTDEPAEVSIANARDEMQQMMAGVAGWLQLPKEVRAEIMRTSFSDAVLTLTESVTAFHERYGTATRENAVENQAKAFAQESGEFVYAIAAMQYGKTPSNGIPQAAMEAADVLFTLIGVATLAGITREQLAEAMRAIAASNDNKTVEKGWNWNARGTKVEKLEVKS